MKIINYFYFFCFFVTITACSNQEQSASTSQESITTSVGQSGVEDGVSEKDIVKVAVGSKDHTTLVGALKAAEYVDVLANAGSFTVFAPTNDAFDKLPKGTVEGLLAKEKKDDLRNILEYHVSVGVYNGDMIQDGQSIGQANGDNITITIKDGKMVVNGVANVIASIKA